METDNKQLGIVKTTLFVLLGILVLNITPIMIILSAVLYKYYTEGIVNFTFIELEILVSILYLSGVNNKIKRG